MCIRDRNKYLVESNPTAPTFKCQVKLHKEETPINKLIISFINTPLYNLSKEVSRMLKNKCEFGIKYKV